MQTHRITKSNPEKPIIFLGSGPYSYTQAEMHISHPQFRRTIAGFAQNLNESARGASFEGYAVYTLEELRPLASTHEAICVLGNCQAKRRFVEQAEAMGFSFASLVHPEGFVSPTATMGEGFLSCYYDVINSQTRIGKHCTVCSRVLLSEATTIGDFVYIGPSVQIAGSVTIGSGVFIGISAAVSDQVTIGDGAVIGAGAVVIRDVPPGATVAGNPAREIARG